MNDAEQESEAFHPTPEDHPDHFSSEPVQFELVPSSFRGNRVASRVVSGASPKSRILSAVVNAVGSNDSGRG
jgi:hypothetical protein